MAVYIEPFHAAGDYLTAVARGKVAGHAIVDKWGRNDTVATALEPIVSSTLAGAFWTPTTALAVRVRAGGDANDTAAGTGARTISVEGLDENYDLATEEITLAGASASAATTTLWTRIHRAFVTTTGTYTSANAAEIIVEATDGTAAITIDAHEANVGQSLHCHYAAPRNTRVFLTHLYYNADTTKTNDVHLIVNDDISNVVAPFGSTRTLLEFEGVNEAVVFVPQSPILLNKPGVSTPTDVWISGAVSSATSVVSARMQLLLIDDVAAP